MDERDARKLSQDAQEELRKQGVKLVLSGMKQTEVAGQFGVTKTTVQNWMVAYREKGWNGLKKGRRGRKKGDNQKLTMAQEKEIQSILVDHTPDQLKMDFALCGRKAVQQLIEDRFKVHYCLQSMSRILKKWGFTPQRPVKRAYEQRPAEVNRWLQEVYPRVEAKAKKENAEIWWGDETAVKPECHFQRGYAPKGQTPVIRQPAKRFHSGLISAINNRGDLKWMALKTALNTESFLQFLKQLIKFRKRKIVLIVDNLRVHHSKIVKAWTEKNKHRIELVYLPSYSPELNPDEYLNNHLKQTVTREGPPKDKIDLDARVRVDMFMLSIRPYLVKAFFNHPRVKYAA